MDMALCKSIYYLFIYLLLSLSLYKLIRLNAGGNPVMDIVFIY